MSTCAHQKEDGSKCRARPQQGSEFCFFHDPTKEGERKAAASEGGRERQRLHAERVLPAETPPVALDDERAIVQLLSETISQVRTGEMSCGVGKTLALLCSVALKAMDQGALQSRVRELEDKLRPLKDLAPEQLLAIVRSPNGAAPS